MLLNDEISKKEECEQLKFEASKIIFEKLPFLLPKEDTEVMLEEDFPYDAGYLGKWRDKHFIVLKVPGDNDVQRLTHEMIHQKFAETIGLEELFGQKITDFLSDGSVKNLSDEEVVRGIIELFEHDSASASNLIFGLTETFSQLAE